MTTQTQSVKVEKTEETKTSWFSNRYVKWGLGVAGVAAVGVAAYYTYRHFSGDKEPAEVVGDVLEQAADVVKSDQ